MEVPKQTFADKSVSWNVISKLPLMQQRNLVVRVVAKLYNVEEDEILSSDRRKPGVLARQHAMYILYEHCKLTQDKIGQLFNRDRSTVTYAIAQTKERLKRNSK